MLIMKGGIRRNIDEKRLQEYRDKGYTAVEEKEGPVKKAERSKE